MWKFLSNILTRILIIIVCGSVTEEGFIFPRMRGVPTLDSTAMNSLVSLHERCRKKDITLILSHANDQPMRVIRKSGFDDLIGKENFCPNIDAAIARAEQIVSKN